MNDRDLERSLDSYFLEPATVPDDFGEVLARLPSTPQQRRRLPSSFPRRTTSMFSPTKLVLAGAIAALLGGFVFAGMLTTSGPETLPVPAQTTESPAASNETQVAEGPAVAVATATPSPDDDAAGRLSDEDYERLLTPTREIVLFHQNARFEADLLKIDGERVDLPNELVHSDEGLKPGTVKVVSRQGEAPNGGYPAWRNLTITWTEREAQPRVKLDFGGDKTHWWVSELVTENADGGRSVYPGPLFKTPKFEPFIGDAKLRSRPAADGARGNLRIDDLLLTPFAGAYVPMEGCTRPAGWDPDLGLLADGQPLTARELEGLTPQAAHDLLEERGICHWFSLGYYWTVTLDEEGRVASGSGSSERWCVPPPDTFRVTRVMPTKEDDVVRLMVDDGQVRSQRWTPIPGVGCRSYDPVG